MRRIRSAVVRVGTQTSGMVRRQVSEQDAMANIHPFWQIAIIDHTEGKID